MLMENNPIYFWGDGTDIDFEQMSCGRVISLIAVTDSDEENCWYHYSVSILVWKSYYPCGSIVQWKGVRNWSWCCTICQRSPRFERLFINLSDKPVRTELEHGDFQLIEMILPERFLKKRFLNFLGDPLSLEQLFGTNIIYPFRNNGTTSQR